VLVDVENRTECEPIIERVLQAAATTVCYGPVHLQVSASIGATVYPQDLGSPHLLLAHADQAMYQAKQLGKNGSRWYDAQA